MLGFLHIFKLLLVLVVKEKTCELEFVIELVFQTALLSNRALKTPERENRSQKPALWPSTTPSHLVCYFHFILFPCLPSFPFGLSSHKLSNWHKNTQFDTHPRPTIDCPSLSLSSLPISEFRPLSSLSPVSCLCNSLGSSLFIQLLHYEATKESNETWWGIHSHSSILNNWTGTLLDTSLSPTFLSFG